MLLMCISDPPALGETKGWPTNRKCPPGQYRANIAAVPWEGDELEHKDHGGYHLTRRR